MIGRQRRGFCELGVREVKLAQQFGHRHDLVLFAVNRHLCEHDPVLGQVGRDEMHAAGVAGRDRTAQGFSINRQDDTSACGNLGRGMLLLKKLAKHAFELGHIHGVAKHATPGALMWHGRSLQAEEGGEFRSPDARPIGQWFEPAVARQFGQHCHQEQDVQRIAHTAGLPLVVERLQALR